VRSRRLHRSLTIVALVALVAACSSGDDDDASPTTVATTTTTTSAAAWTMFGRDHANTRHSVGESTLSAANVARIEERWRWDGAAVTSTPAVVDGIVYVATWDGELLALDADDGGEVWTSALQDGMLSPSPFVSDDSIYIAGDGGKVFGVDRATGEKRWETDIETTPFDRVWSSPVLVDDVVIVGSASYQVFVEGQPVFRGSVVGLDAATGDERWRASVCDDPCNGVSVWSSAAVDPELGLAFIGTGQSYSGVAGPMSDSVVAIDYLTGEIRWHHQYTAGDEYSVASMAGPDHDVGAAPNLFEIDGRPVVGAGDKGGTYKVFDRATGDVIWERNVVGGSPLGGIEETTAYADGIVYLLANTSIEATSRADAVPASAIAFALDAATGDIVWQTDIDEGGFGGVSIANDLMLFTTHEGTLHVLDIADGTEVHRTSVGERSASGPVVIDGVLYVGNGWDWASVPRGGLVALALNTSAP
jgi:polyvinyl alcohol dehydrogenase (cytochrome)